MADSFERFWTASTLTSLTQRAFADRLGEHRAPPRTADPFVLPGAPHALHRPDDRLQRLFARRRSDRDFAAGPLSARDLGAVLGALAGTRSGGRAYPSAGGLNAVRGYPLLLDVDHALSGRITRYDADRHALQDIAECPKWTDLAPLVGATPDSAAPHLLVVLALADAEQFAKYGERAGRFGLIEAGAAAQTLALRVAERGLAGFLLGGAADRELLGLLGLTTDRVRVAAVLAGGRKPKRRRVFAR
ncbi:nitroreductase family protein [Actinokineospora sp.]|uniref:nitroreductase family protein n=1 Tax=Actinokineospora sp. TaxID=1872133 RepID=UPI0040376963